MVYFLANEIRVFLVMPFLTNQKIISVIFWLVEIDQSGSRLTNQWDTSVSPRLNGVLLPLKSHIQWQKRSGYPLPLSRAASLLAPPHPHSTDISSPGGQTGLLPTSTPSTTELNSRIKALDLATREPRPSTSTSVTCIWLLSTSPSPRRGNISDKVESQVTQTTRRSYEKTERKCGSKHYVALAHTAFTGVTKLTHTPPTLLQEMHL